jgi:L-lactate dehydrogenase
LGGIPITQVVSESKIDYDAIARDAKQKGAAIMESKGATNYGIGGVAASICKSILFDERNVRLIQPLPRGARVLLELAGGAGEERRGEDDPDAVEQRGGAVLEGICGKSTPCYSREGEELSARGICLEGCIERLRYC